MQILYNCVKAESFKLFYTIFIIIFWRLRPSHTRYSSINFVVTFIIAITNS